MSVRGHRRLHNRRILHAKRSPGILYPTPAKKSEPTENPPVIDKKTTEK